jgi:hypothetical protein
MIMCFGDTIRFCVTYGRGEMKVEASVIRPNEKLVRVEKEPHARKHAGKLVAWFVTDKHNQVMLCSGKLSKLQAYINAHMEAKHDRVHLSGLYETMGRQGGRTGGWYLNRWSVTHVPLEDAASVFEKLRPVYERSVLIAPRTAYQTAEVV